LDPLEPPLCKLGLPGACAASLDATEGLWLLPPLESERGSAVGWAGESAPDLEKRGGDARPLEAVRVEPFRSLKAEAGRGLGAARDESFLSREAEAGRGLGPLEVEGVVALSHEACVMGSEAGSRRPWRSNEPAGALPRRIASTPSFCKEGVDARLESGIAGAGMQSWRWRLSGSESSSARGSSESESPVEAVASSSVAAADAAACAGFEWTWSFCTAQHSASIASPHPSLGATLSKKP